MTKNKILALASLTLLVSAGTAMAGTSIWQERTDSAKWGNLMGHNSVAVGNRVWVLGGLGGGNVTTNDVWSSPRNNGSDWDTITLNANWQSRAASASTVFNGRVWIMGGFNSSFQNLNDVWSSATNNGSTWTESTNIPWSARHGMGLVTFNPGTGSNMWLMGGMNNSNQTLNDVWKTNNGSTWTQVTANAPWSARRYAGVVVLDGKMWVVGGLTNTNQALNDVWSTTDGLNWTQVTANAPWEARGYHSVVSDGKRIWVIGGYNPLTNTRYNDVWTSEDGINWTEVEANSPWAPRFGSSAVYIPSNGRIWLMGGGANTPAFSDVWSVSSAEADYGLPIINSIK